MQTKHLLGHCEMCGPFAQCATCGNNCCNGTYGGEPGNWCPDCPDAYEVQTLYFKDPDAVEFAGKGRTIPLPDYLKDSGSVVQ